MKQTLSILVIIVLTACNYSDRVSEITNEMIKLQKEIDSLKQIQETLIKEFPEDSIVDANRDSM